MSRFSILRLVSCLLAAAAAVGAQHLHPPGDAGAPQTGATSTLTAEQVQQLLDGEGMGLARAAESAGYPGPKHVLDLAKELQLTPAQQRRVTEIRLRVIADAQRYGRAIVEAERALDEAFRTGAINDVELASRVRSIATLQGELRLVHLAAHLELRPLLTAQQLRRYAELRGYSASAS